MARSSNDYLTDLIDPVEKPDSGDESVHTQSPENATPSAIDLQTAGPSSLVFRELETLLENIDYGIMFMGPDLRARLINSAFKSMWGVDDEFAARHPDFFEMIEYLRERGAYAVTDEDWPDYVRVRYQAVREADGVTRESKRHDGRVLLYKCLPLPDGGRMLTYFDITEQKSAEKELAASRLVLEDRVRELELLKHQMRAQRDSAVEAADLIADSHELLSEVIENVHQAVLVWDDEGRLVVCNRRIRHIYPDMKDLFQPGLAFEEMIREGHRRGVLPSAPDGCEDTLVAEWMAKHETGRGADERQLGDGRWIRIVRRKTEHGKRVVTITDISDEKESEARIQDLAESDPLTGLANRRAFDGALAKAVDRGMAQQGAIGLLLIDLDRFKEINDAHGHPAGDAVLKQVAARLTGCLRRADMAARIGGDEFAVIVDDVNEQETLGQMADRIVAAMAEPAMFAGNALSISASIGGAHCPHDSQNPEDLVVLADRALYAAKQSGRGAARLHSTIVTAD